MTRTIMLSAILAVSMACAIPSAWASMGSIPSCSGYFTDLSQNEYSTGAKAQTGILSGLSECANLVSAATLSAIAPIAGGISNKTLMNYMKGHTLGTQNATPVTPPTPKQQKAIQKAVQKEAKTVTKALNADF